MAATNETFEALKAKFRIIPSDRIERPPVLIRIGQSPALAAGDISTLTGKAKSGKTFILSAIVAAALSGVCQAFIHIVGFVSGIVLYFDTEQSDYYSNATIQRICRLAGSINQPNLHAYKLRDIGSPAARLEFIEHVINSTPGVKFIVIDGIRDLLTKGINDEEEATSLTNKLMQWSGELNAHILCVLHQNKGNDMVRGHIGTEMINKSGTVIQVSKSDTDKRTFIVSAERTRDIEFDDFAFIINDDSLPELAAMPDRAAIRRDKAISKAVETLTYIFSKGQPLKQYSELINDIAETEGIAIATAKRRIGEAKKAGKLIKTESGLYKLAKDDSETTVPY